MLKKVSYLGHELVSSSFSLKKEPKSKGFYKYNISIGDEFSFVNVHRSEGEHLHNEISISIDSYAHGFEKDSEEPVFIIDINFIIRFEIDKDQFIEKDYAIENEWFFMNFASIASKSIIDSILSHTALKGTFIPAHRLPEV
ncbi:hypothetical protein [Vibrio cholerae]|uniref:hypothetical protein n=1 Tax=Vibrio cholerae TaxID=666 RepID=UPI001DE8644C|nr:hypothetical protein [Vibrio cholerae]MCR9871834.1 hypothetical protein [Vibrio cholerae]MVC34261.1 hypothetical protein [Vibrio cholerae]